MMEWIKCSDRMPEPNVKVLIFNARESFQNNNEPDINVLAIGAFILKNENLTGDWFMGVTKWDEVDYDICYNPTHWMPLPEIPNLTKETP